MTQRARSVCGALVAAAALVGLGGAGGCGGKACPPAAAPALSAPPVDELSSRLRAFEDAACACVDHACVTAARRELTGWAERHGAEVDRAMGNPLRRAQVQSYLARVDECAVPLLRPGRGSDEDTDAGDDDADLDDEGGADGDSDADQVLADFGRLADELCLCTDQACADAVMGKLSSLRDPRGKLSQRQMERAMAIAERMAECQKRIMSAGGTP